jgi:hypothetical protein
MKTPEQDLKLREALDKSIADYPQHRRLFESARDGDTSSLYSVGIMFCRGEKVDVDEPLGIYYLKSSKSTVANDFLQRLAAGKISKHDNSRKYPTNDAACAPPPVTESTRIKLTSPASRNDYSMAFCTHCMKMVPFTFSYSDQIKGAVTLDLGGPTNLTRVISETKKTTHCVNCGNRVYGKQELNEERERFAGSDLEGIVLMVTFIGMGIVIILAFILNS